MLSLSVIYSTQASLFQWLYCSYVEVRPYLQKIHTKRFCSDVGVYQVGNLLNVS